MIVKNYVFILFLGALIFPARPAMAAYDEAWEEYISAQKKIQVKTHHHLALRFTHLRELIDKSQELQLAIADEKTARFYRLKETDPGRIQRGQGFAAFVNFDWKAEDEAQFLEASEDYRELHAKIEKLTQEVESDLQWEELTAKLQMLKEDPRYVEVIAPFRFVPQRVEEILNRQ